MKIIFDLDDTLYVKPELTKKRDDVIFEFLGNRKEEFLECRKLHGTIGSFIEMGIGRQKFFDLMSSVPINLERDAELIRILTNLKNKHKLIVLSNNSEYCLRMSLEKLGILDLIDEFYATENLPCCKPGEECFFMVEQGDICVGNSFRKDLMVPKQKGATTIFVGGEHLEADFSVNNIYEIEKIINNCYETQISMKVKIKRLHPKAALPKYAYPGDAGMDIISISREETENFVEYGTGLAFEIPEGYACLVYPRSSISNTGFILANSVGVLDSHYRGELKLRFKKIGQIGQPEYKVGERIAQIVIIPFPKIEFEEVKELSETERGTRGLGSSGN